MLSQVDSPSFPNEDPPVLGRLKKSAASFWALAVNRLFPRSSLRPLFHYSRDEFFKELSVLSEQVLRNLKRWGPRRYFEEGKQLH